MTVTDLTTYNSSGAGLDDMSIERRPAYRRITDYLLQILPTMSVGDPLPTIAELGERFAVSGVQTIRDGVQPLVDAGYVTTQFSPNRRWIVQALPASAPTHPESRAKNLRLEQAAVLAVQRWFVTETEFTMAVPAVDTGGIDLLAFRPAPFKAVPVQVKAASVGLTVWQQYAVPGLLIAYVLDPLSVAANVCLLTGIESWELPRLYVERGGRASDYDAADGYSYRWKRVTGLLDAILAERVATPERWAMLIAQAD
jgi:hypothetical protein